ncbi:solute carrier organic anion transporter family member 4A1-like [Amphiura filiformis]|uniref:solute carrier organic anion transporter family member 4A1-like n=1 Tax=Amphiura filiformis TaxID=82378 RepID=UPI003B2191B4
MASSDSEREVPTSYDNEGYSDTGDKQENAATAERNGTSKDQTDNEILDEEELKPYGYGSCRPKCMQMLNNSKCFLFVLCLYCFTQGMAVNGLVYTMISTLERRFNLTSVQSAFISSSYDLFGMFFVVFVTYFGENGHKPRLIGISAIIFSLGSITFTLPHYLAGPYNAEGAVFDTCDVNRTVTDPCDGDDENLQKYYAVFIVAQMLHALGASTIYNLGLTHIDENVTPGTAAIYTGYTEAQKKRRNETRSGSQFQSQNKISQFPKAVLALLKNPTYVLITVGVIAEAFLLAFVSVFGPKIVESLFNVTASTAALLAGVVPGPIAFGALLDRACLLWEYECDGSQNCWLCDNSQITIYLVLMTSACRLVSIIAFTGAVLVYKPPTEGAYQEDEEKAVYDVEMN